MHSYYSDESDTKKYALVNVTRVIHFVSDCNIIDVLPAVELWYERQVFLYGGY